MPPELLKYLTDYIYDLEGNLFLACSKAVVQWPFAHLTILKNDYSGAPRKVQIPVQHVLAIVDGSSKEALPIGFLKKTN
jgi:stringent starvation protein B